MISLQECESHIGYQAMQIVTNTDQKSGQFKQQCQKKMYDNTTSQLKQNSGETDLVARIHQNMPKNGCF